jgi:hypothetical protein
MQIIKLVLVFCFLFKISAGRAQITYLPNSSREYHLLDRLDIKNIDSGSFNLFSPKPTSRKTAVQYGQFLDSVLKKRNSEFYDLSPVDRYNLDKLEMNNTEWLRTPTKKYNSKKPVADHFFLTKNNLFEIHKNDFEFYLNPMIQQVQSVELNNSKRVYLNSKGLEIRGIIGKKIGFYSSLTDNQENGPLFYAKRVDSLQSVTGAGYYKRFKPLGSTDKGQDYFDYRGYITFNVAKFLDVQYGYDKNFIGNGYRSLFLSDISAPTLFLKLNTRIWKLNYMNLFMELTPTFTGLTGGSLNEKKYAAMHHLGIQISNNLTLGLFESVIFKRRNKFEFGYLVPVIFYRAVESGLGSADNALLGADFKFNFEQHLQFYGQALLDEFKLSYFKDKNWGNKVGGQAGFKYIDVAGLKNLDMQIEWNIVRPYTYSHFDSATTYTNYNQPLAHPVGANFNDVVFIMKYQPANKLFFEFKAFLIQQGIDSTKNQIRTFGGNIFRTYNSRVGNIDQTMLQGVSAKTFISSFSGSYEWKPNLFLEANLLIRNYKLPAAKTQQTIMISAGVRWNMARREIDY